MTVKHARENLLQEEVDKIIDMDNVNEEAITLAEEQGIIFIDEIDKIIGKSKATSSADVSREGVQRDIHAITNSVTLDYGKGWSEVGKRSFQTFYHVCFVIIVLQRYKKRREKASQNR